MNDIAISVVVAVYNTEEYLGRCLDSLVFQTLENIEILVVDDFSTDKSWDILQMWQSRFPDKIRIMKSREKGVAHAKNTGIQAARGQYIAFVDSDDYTDYKMFEKMYQEAEENEFPEIIFSPFWEIRNTNRRRIAKLDRHETIADYLAGDAFYLHCKLFRNDLFERFGFLPILGIGEDTTWFYCAISNCVSIHYYSTSSCYYYERRTTSVSMNDANPTLVGDLLAGSDYILQNSNPEYAEQALLFVAKRMLIHARIKPGYQDVFYNYIEQHIDQIKEIEDLETKAPDVAKYVAWHEEQNPVIPQIVYINGFVDSGENYSEYEKVFREPPVITVLNRANCDMEAAPLLVRQAYKAGNMDFVGKYFAAKACYTQGGVYIDPAIEIDLPFNSLVNDLAFFGFESDCDFTDKVFGCCRKNPVFEKILRTYNCPELYDDIFAPLSKRIRTVLIGCGNISLYSQLNDCTQYGFHIYPVDMFVYTLPYAEQLHVCHYKPEAFIREDSITIPVPVLKALSDRLIRVNDQSRKIKRLRIDIEWLKNKAARLEAKQADLLKDRDWLYNKASRLEAKQADLLKDRDWLYNKASRLENKADRLEAKQADLLKDRDWLYNKASRLEENVKSLDQELNAYRSSKLVRIAWRIQCFFGKVKHQLVKK